MTEHLAEHRFYDVEVLDFSKDVSFILLLPPRDLVCSIHSQPSTSAGKSTTTTAITTTTNHHHHKPLPSLTAATQFRLPSLATTTPQKLTDTSNQYCNYHAHPSHYQKPSITLADRSDLVVLYRLALLPVTIAVQ